MFSSIKLSPNDILFNEGDPSDFIYILQRGELEIFKKDQKTNTDLLVGNVYANEMFGEMSFLENQPRSATAKAKTNCQVGLLNRVQFAEIMKAQHPMIQELVLTLSERLRKTNDRLTM